MWGPILVKFLLKKQMRNCHMTIDREALSVSRLNVQLVVLIHVCLIHWVRLWRCMHHWWDWLSLLAQSKELLIPWILLKLLLQLIEYPLCLLNLTLILCLNKLHVGLVIETYAQRCHGHPCIRQSFLIDCKSRYP